jgi:hypothetical protein
MVVLMAYLMAASWDMHWVVELVEWKADMLVEVTAATKAARLARKLAVWWA